MVDISEDVFYTFIQIGSQESYKDMVDRCWWFLGQGWVEMATPEDAAKALAKNGQRVLNRPLYINYQPPDPKDLWPPPSSKV